MTSIMGKEVAKEVISKVRKGEKINMQEIQTKHGYSKKSAKSMKAKETKGFKEVVDPVVAGMRKFQEALVAELTSPARIAKLPKEKLIFMSGALKNTTHDLQLLTGGKTESNGVEELAESINNWITNSKNDR